MDIVTLGAAKSYTDSAINGLSILVGKNCEISNIEVLPNGNKITFTWWDSNNVQQSNDITVLNGEKGEQGEKGIQGVSITNVEINEENHLILTLSDSTIIDAGEIVNDTTALTTHTGDTNVHVTAEDKTALSLMPKSKAETLVMTSHDYQDFVIPILNLSSGSDSNEFFYGKIYLKRGNSYEKQMTIINLMCAKNYNEEKAVYYIDRSEVWTNVMPCSFTYNSKRMFGIHVKILSCDYNVLRIDARTTTDFNIITPVYVYNNNKSEVINAEIQNSLSFFDGHSIPINFYETPKVVKYDGSTLIKSKLLSFSPAPATATATGTAGEIAYDSNYIYVCTGTNTWKRVALSSW